MNNRSKLSLAVCLGVSVCSLSASAQDGVHKDPMQSRFLLNLDDPESSVPQPEEADKHPLDWGYLLMEIDERAHIAAVQKDWKSAIKFHRAAAKMAPDRAISYALLCTDYENAGQRANAVDACFKSLNLDGAKLEYFAHYIRLVADRPGGTDPEEVESALQVIAHLKSDKSGELTGYEMQCELGLRTGSENALSECSRELLKRQPHSPRAISYAWALAVQRKDFKRARKLISEAKRDGATPAAITKMEEATKAAEQAERGDAPIVSAREQPRSTPPASDDAPPTGPVGKSEVAAPQASAALAVSSTHAAQGMHPMLRWLLGLLVAIGIAVPVARRFVAPRRNV
jgi:tetratricopeptide (TPR) repeat protein